MQNQTLSPPPVYYLWGFGLFWPPAMIGGIDALRQRSPLLTSLLAWVVAAFLLAYAPFAIQRRFLLGATIPLGLLAARGIEVSAKFISQRSAGASRRMPLIGLLAGLSISMTSLIFFPAQALFMRRQPMDYFYPRTFDQAFSWISENTPADDVLLSATRTGQLIAQKTGRRVFLGHEMETLRYDGKAAAVESFYKGQPTVPDLVLNSVGWVIYGPYEREIDPNFIPPPSLKLAAQIGDVSIYQIKARP